jgi:hypothetical protein
VAPAALALLDVVQDWTIVQLILAAAVLTVLVLVGSYAMATAWRRWKEGKRAQAAQAKGLPAPRRTPPTGLRFTPKALAAKVAGKANAPAGAPAAEPQGRRFAVPKLSLKLGRKEQP